MAARLKVIAKTCGSSGGGASERELRPETRGVKGNSVGEPNGFSIREEEKDMDEKEDVREEDKDDVGADEDNDVGAEEDEERDKDGMERGLGLGRESQRW